VDKDKSYSLSDLRLIVGESTPKSIMLGMQFANNHADRLIYIRRAVDYVAQEMSKNSHLKQDRSEDELTGDIISNLKCMGFAASHDTQYGGHCDIVVEAKDEFLWIAEAKKHGGYDWLLKGFQQLDTRYTTGADGQDSAELIIYHFGQRTDKIVTAWADYLKDNRGDVEIRFAAGNKLHFHTEHTHKRTGRNFNIRHLAINLYFKPEDSGPRGPQS
jgi:hypothetical protein